MKRALWNLAVMLGTWAISAAAFAQGGGAQPEVGTTVGMGLIALGSGLAIGLATFGATNGQGRATASAVEGIARNPGSREQVFMPFILGLVFMELQALLGFVIAFMWYIK